MSSSAALESTYAYALNDLFGDNKIDKFELAKVGQSTEHNYCGVNCGIMDQFASVFGKKGSLIRLDCRSLEYQYFPFDPQGYRLVLVDSVVKHELASSAYNKRRQSCEAAVAAVQKKHPHVEFLRDVTMGMLEEAKADIIAEDYMRAEYVIEEIQRVLDVCDALEKGDYETVGQKMYETHHGMSKLYEVSCEELDFLNDLAFDCGVTGSRVMGGGFGGCTINLVKDELYSTFIEKAKDEFKKKFGRSPKVYDGHQRRCPQIRIIDISIQIKGVFPVLSDFFFLPYSTVFHSKNKIIREVYSEHIYLYSQLAQICFLTLMLHNI